MQHTLSDISSFVSKLLRKNFGKGPISCHAYAKDRFLVFYIRGFLSPMEKVLIENDNLDNIVISRNIVMESVLNELKGLLELNYQQDVEYLYHDWNYANNTGMITAVFEKVVPSFESSVHFPKYEDFIAEIERLTILIQKKPKQIQAFQITSKVYLVIREGILVPIEKAMIQKGYEQKLLVVKDELEKSFCQRNGRFEQIFKKQIGDMFVDWNLKEDKSLTYLFLTN
ncbi:Na-translocating system protein MpsC family protein [Neobacillus dielmonensis]|uniref:Na-translocating system protein MpsC family protein n=1 Tax=Neobacillus dielmonensis TaxID=1347369 RepID=UPI00094257BD|nr:Na-translocating system protein MpsC family protein [Neobacillus dielmonensis]